MGAVIPRDFHADLTEERLEKVAQLIASGRDDAMDLYAPERGFNGWLLGCCAYQFGRFRIERAVQDGAFSWLRIMLGTRHFIFQIGSVPVRFYRDDPDDPSEKVLRQSELEAQQLSLALGGDEARDGVSFRLVVQTGIGGELLRIVFLALRSGETILVWNVPLHKDGVRAPLVAVGSTPRDEGVTLPAPTVTVRQPAAGVRSTG
jgi:hypothetical protein